MKAVDFLDMPELINTEYPVYLDDSEQEKYEGLKKDLILSTSEHEVTVANAASLVNKLSQMANGAVYTDDEDIVTFHDKKLDALEDIIESANGKPLLVAYWFGITWSLELYQQCVCRLYRQGQTEGTVTIIHLITQGTVDEKIMKALSEKDNTQSALIEAVKAEI